MPGHTADSCPTADRSRTTAQKTWTGGWAVEHVLMSVTSPLSLNILRFSIFELTVAWGRKMDTERQGVMHNLASLGTAT